MPNQKQIRTNDLTVGNTAFVRGHVTYSHIRTHVAGEALARANEKARLRGGIAKDKPYTTISICDAQVMLGAGQTTYNMEQAYVNERLFNSNNPEYTGLSYTAESKSNRLPDVGEFLPDAKDIRWLSQLDGELAKGLDVTLVMEVFAGNPNKGFGLKAVIVNEPIRYWGGGRPLAPQLQQYGYNATSEPPVRQATTVGDDMPEDNDPYVGGAMPAGTPVPAPSGNPYDTNAANRGPAMPPQPAAGGPAPAGYYPPQTAPGGQTPSGYYPPNANQAPYGTQQPAPGYAGGAPTPPPAPAYPNNTPPATSYPGPGQVQEGPFGPGPVPGYPAQGTGITYDPNQDPNRQY